MIADFHMNRTSITPWFSVSACSQFTFIFFTMILLRTLPGSEMQWPKIFPKHPQIIQNILLQVKCSPPRWRQVLSQPDRASVDVGTLEASVSSCQVQFFNSNVQHIRKHMLTSHRCPEMTRDVRSRTDPMFEALEQMPSNVCLDQLPKMVL